MFCSKSDCTGCMACYNICPSKALYMTEDEEGFLVPSVDYEKCIECNKCSEVCPQLKKSGLSDYHIHDVYACWNKKVEVKKDSSSGGLFTALSEVVIGKGGVVYGAGYDQEFNVCHKGVNTLEGLKELQGSKYVQSNIGLIYNEVRDNLEKNKLVLFSGTPCQLQGLKYYLKKDYDNLITCDFVCHGAASQKVYRDYLNNLSEDYKSEIKNIKFRDKSSGWRKYSMKVEFQNGKKYIRNVIENPYLIGFIKGYYLRESCYKCRYANVKRVSDVTMGDFWGYETEDNNGVSLALINTDKGGKLFDEAKENLVYFKSELQKVIDKNPSLIRASKIPKKREAFWSDYRKSDSKHILKKYTNSKILLLKYKIISLITSEKVEKVKKIILKKSENG